MYFLKGVLNFFLDFLFFENKEDDDELELLLQNSPSSIINKIGKSRRKNLPTWIKSILSYKDPRVKKWIWKMKFRADKQIAIKFGEMLAIEISEFLDKASADYPVFILPVPIHFRRRIERGFNQTEWICESIIKNLNRELFDDKFLKISYNPHILKRSKYTKKQSWVNRNERVINSKNIFVVKNKFRSLLKNATVIIIDDVVTTGETLKNIKVALLTCDPYEIVAFTIAN